MSTELLIQPDFNLTASNSDKLKQQLSEAIHSGKKNIVIDLDGVEIIDSTGLSVLIFAHNRVKNVHPLVLQNVSDDIKRLLSITRLDKYFEIG